jgi:hypothetical protein
MIVDITEEERQMIILALAKLSLERPGWDRTLNELALKMDNKSVPPQTAWERISDYIPRDRAVMYDQFRELHR